MRAYDVVYIGFVTGHGGDALQMLSLAAGIQQTGLRVKIVVPRVAESVAFQERCRDAGVECERSRLITADMTGSRQSLREVFRLVRANQAPIMHFHSGNSCLPRSLMPCLAFSRHVHAVATLQSPVETIQPGSVRARTWSFFANRRLGAVISPSDHGTNFQRRLGVDLRRTLTIRNAIEVRRFSTGDPLAPRAALGVAEDDEIVLFCSRVDAQKRPEEAVEAFARVAPAFPRSHLVFVGSGSEEAAVRKAAAALDLSHRIHMVGYQTNIPDWLAAATVWFLPTERENFSVALLEALAAGCPVLSTNCPGNDEILVDGRNAVTFGVGDIEGAAQGLARLLGDPGLRAQLSAQAKRTAEEYSVDSLVQGVRRIYDKLDPTLPQGNGNPHRRAPAGATPRLR